MSTVLYVPDPMRELTDVKIKGWPIVISHGIILGSMAIHPQHPMNVSRGYEVHIARRSYAELTINLYAWPILENEIVRLKQRITKYEK